MRQFLSTLLGWCGIGLVVASVGGLTWLGVASLLTGATVPLRVLGAGILVLEIAFIGFVQRERRRVRASEQAHARGEHDEF